MNRRFVYNIIGKVLIVLACALLLPLLVALINKEGERIYLSYIITICIALLFGLPSLFIKVQDNAFHAKEGFVSVALSWLVLSLIGAFPYVLSNAIPNYINAFFETASGLSTTGASILNEADYDKITKSIQFWRALTHWMGGMGVLVFVLAVLPKADNGFLHAFKAESPGPSVSKIVAKLGSTARILYGLYFVFTLVETLLLWCGEMDFFESIFHAFSTAGTGGFGIKSDSLASYSSYSQIVISIFMIMFSINFTLFYLLMAGHFLKVLKSEEMWTFLCIILISTTTISLDLFFTKTTGYDNYLTCLKDSFFQVTSLSSSTGFSTADFNVWPAFAKSILLIIMVVGACAGSTGGGLKVSRFLIIIKSIRADLHKMVHPKQVITPRFEGEPLSDRVVTTTRTYFIIWATFVIIVTILISIDGYVNDFLSNFTAAIACIGNVGPGFNLVGPTYSYAGYSYFSKIVLALSMLAGRLEILPMLILLSPRTYKKI